MTSIFLCGGLFLFNGCEESNDNLTEELVLEEVDPRFARCYFDEDLAKNKADSVICSFFGSKASSFAILNREVSFIGCDEGNDLAILPFGDENCCAPRTYDLIYDLILNRDTVYQISLFAGSDMQFDFSSESEKRNLFPYKLLVDGDIEFDYADLRSEMKRLKMNIEQYEIELIRDTLQANLPNSMYWELSFLNDDGDMMFMRVNARNGAFSQIRPMTRMGD